MERMLTLAFTAQQMDYVANVLAQRPYAEVFPILAEIQRQIAAQQQLPEPLPNGQDHPPLTQ